MKNRWRHESLILALMILIATCLVAETARAATDQAIQRVGCVDLLAVQFSAIPVKERIDAAEKKMLPMRAEIEEKMKKLEEMRNEARNPSLLSKERQDELQKSIDGLQDEIGELEYRINREMDRELNQTMSEAGDLIVNGVEAVAREKGFTLILSKELVVYGARSCDITQDVVDYLNQYAAKKKAEAGEPAPSSPPAAAAPKPAAETD
jgi:Skp family chaperone for outer membrane proteins